MVSCLQKFHDALNSFVGPLRFGLGCSASNINVPDLFEDVRPFDILLTFCCNVLETILILLMHQVCN